MFSSLVTRHLPLVTCHGVLAINFSLLVTHQKCRSIISLIFTTLVVALSIGARCDAYIVGEEERDKEMLNNIGAAIEVICQT
jgi:hypothetical protein